MAGEYMAARSREALIKKLRRTTPYGAKVMVQRAKSWDKNIKGKGLKGYYVLIDVMSKNRKKLLWHN